MEVSDLLSPEAVIISNRLNSRKQLFQRLAEKAEQLTGLPGRRIFDSLFERERLGSTGIGNGVAIPHGKFDQLSSITGLFVVLRNPVDYEAIDGQPVDIVFALLAPQGAGADHLKALAKVARVLRGNETLNAIRECDTPAAIYALLTAPVISRVA